MNHIITTPGRVWIPASKAVAETDTAGQAGVSGFYKRQAGGILFYDLEGTLFAFLVNNRHGIFFVTANTTLKGTWFMQSTTSKTEQMLGIEGMGYSAQKELEQRIVHDLESARALSLLSSKGIAFEAFVAMANQEPTSALARQAFYKAGLTLQEEGIEHDGYLLATKLGRSMLFSAGYDLAQGKWTKTSKLAA